MQNKIETRTFISLVRPTIHSVAKAFQKWKNFKTENDDITKTIWFPCPSFPQTQIQVDLHVWLMCFWFFFFLAHCGWKNLMHFIVKMLFPNISDIGDTVVRDVLVYVALSLKVFHCSSLSWFLYSHSCISCWGAWPSVTVAMYFTGTSSLRTSSLIRCSISINCNLPVELMAILVRKPSLFMSSGLSLTTFISFVAGNVKL